MYSVVGAVLLPMLAVRIVIVASYVADFAIHSAVPGNRTEVSEDRRPSPSPCPASHPYPELMRLNQAGSSLQHCHSAGEQPASSWAMRSVVLNQMFETMTETSLVRDFPGFFRGLLLQALQALVAVCYLAERIASVTKRASVARDSPRSAEEARE